MGELKISKTFVDYMGENANFRDIIEAGKGNLQWERDIPPEALANLEALAAKDFKGNLGREIYNGRETSLLRLLQILKLWLPKISKETWEELSTIFTKLPMLCFVICHKAITRKEQSTDLPLKP